MVGSSSLCISLIQFADDSLFMVDAKKIFFENLRVVLLLFEAASSLKINFQKSKIMGVGEVS